jgi:DNA-directed RNA polymerase specialized sigma24 family protein
MDLSAIVRLALESLRQTDRGLLVARYLDEQSAAAIARALGVRRSIVRKRLAAARRRLRGALRSQHLDREVR